MKPIKPAWSVLAATPSEDYSIRLVFADGSKRIFDARPLLDESFFEPLRNLPFFMSGHAECGTVVWNDDIDIAPEHLYAKSITVS